MRSWERRQAVGVPLVLAAGFAFRHGPVWLFLPLAVLACGFAVHTALTVGLPPTRRRRETSPVRALFLVWLALMIAVTVLVWIGGFQPDDRILLAGMWAFLALGWALDRAWPKPS